MRTGVVVAFALAVLGLAMPAARAACMHGDVDGDSICDADDPCRNPEPHALREPRVSISRRLAGTGDALVRFSGIVPLYDDVPADPAASGLRLVVREGNGDTSHLVVDVALAPIVSWAKPRAGEWIHRDPSVVEGIRSARVREIVPRPAYQAERAYVVTIDARTSRVPALSDALWHHVSLVLDGTHPTARCADQPFRPRLIDAGQTWQLWDGRCKTSASGGMRCRSGRLRSPCRVSRAEDELRCLLADIARGQEVYRAANGRYCSFHCLGLLSSTPPPYATFATIGSIDHFWTIAAHAAAPGIVCNWESDAMPHLTCGRTP
jgi:hypothetical protein